MAKWKFRRMLGNWSRRLPCLPGQFRCKTDQKCYKPNNINKMKCTRKNPAAKGVGVSFNHIFNSDRNSSRTKTSKITKYY